MKIAGIVLYNPNIERLKDNVEAVINQVDLVYLVDNKSLNIDEIVASFCNYEKIVFNCFDKNLGIAKALNDISSFAISKDAEWVLTLDQDSIAPANMIKEYEKYTEDNQVGMICCNIYDLNFSKCTPNYSDCTKYVSNCITSGSYIRLKAWQDVGGYFEPLFIDQVDFDMCLLLRNYNYKILKVNNVILTHEVGCSKPVKLLGRDDISTNHPPLRYYYMCRNMIIVAKRHQNWKHCCSALLRRILVVNFCEKMRLKKK